MTPSKKTNVSTKKQTASKVASKKVVTKKSGSQQHIADQIKVLSSQRVWPD